MSTSTQPDSGFLTEYQVYEPHKTGLPPMRPYLTELWRRRHFAAELSRTNMRASNTRTFFGQIWLVINPLLLAFVCPPDRSPVDLSDRPTTALRRRPEPTRGRGSDRVAP